MSEAFDMAALEGALERELVLAAEAYDRAVDAIADAIIARIPLDVMSRLVQPYRWSVVVEGAKHAVIAKLGEAFDLTAWDDGKQQAWDRLAKHNGYAWPKRRAA